MKKINLARRRNWAKLRVSGMHATAKQLKGDLALPASIRAKLQQVETILKDILRKWR